ncbi:MAG: dehydrogenase [Prevotella sp.]|nr:dehydrogenase [Prevotella sp.]
MADGFIEKRQQDYEARKEAYLRKKKHLPANRRKPAIGRPDDEAL